MKTYRAAVIGCSRMGGFIDNEVIGAQGIPLPYSHAAGFTACGRTELVACSDLRSDVMAEFGRLHGVQAQGQYTDYREMLAKEGLDIVSVATQPEPRAEIVIECVGRGVKAVYAEKAMAASMAEADAMVEAVESNGAILNLGTNRRWDARYDRMKEIIDSGELGELEHLIVYQVGTLFNSGSHHLDLVLRLNSDHPAAWVQGHLPEGDPLFEGDVLTEDPRAEGIIQFVNGVTAHVMLTARRSEYEAICSKGTITAIHDGLSWQVRRASSTGLRGRDQFHDATPPETTPNSSTLCLIEDLVHSLDTGEPPRGGVRAARAGNELIFGLIESHRAGGARVSLPLEKRTTRLVRNRAPRLPKYRPD
ncbi:MAG: Gfo/Idh/MocA family oxidoreductase [Caldilineaceae bacterium]|nr:Gfo/Idh/MocA family oxidoreductase [Caldilineaceae bacterium]